MPDKEGWYPDPEFPGKKRYWDGSRWAAVDPELLSQEKFYPLDLLNKQSENKENKKSFYAKTLESRMTQYTDRFDNYSDDKKKTIIFLALIMFVSMSVVFGVLTMTLSSYNYARVAALDLQNNYNTALIDGEYEMVADGSIYDGEKCAFIGVPKAVNRFSNTSDRNQGRVIVVGTGVGLCSNASNNSLVKFTVREGYAGVNSIE